MARRTIRRSLPVLPALAALAIATGAGAMAAPEGYLDHDGLAAAVRRMDTDDRCSLAVLGSSRQGRGLFALTLSSDPKTAGERPAVLVVAGLDGRHLVGTETALRVARRVLDEHADMLEDVTVYVLPRMNPDAAEVNLGAVDGGQGTTMRVTDDDHDGDTDEDPPTDLNGDGAITMMRRANPPLDVTATHMSDPGAPRLLVVASADEGERATYAVYREGLDADGDGAIAEDPVGGVDLDSNFMHEWPEFDAHAGPYQLSEPESHALATFVFEHRNIVAAIVYGRHDNMVNAPSDKGRDVSGEAPKVIDPGDAAIYRRMGERFKETTGQTRAPKESFDGSFVGWLYAQRGLPTFATVVWGRPDPSPAPEAEAPDEDADDGEDADDEKPAKPKDEEDAAWLEYSDRDRDGAGFVEWTPFDHPTLGAVEIGGFVPGFRMNPPAAQLDDLAAGQTAFLVEVVDHRPRLAMEGPTVRALALGLYEVRLGLVNDGMLPTATTMARTARSVPPIVVRLSVEPDRIVAGNRVERVWGIEGSGARQAMRWIIRADPGGTESIDVRSPSLGARTLEIELP